MSEPLMIPYPNAGSGHAGNATSRERQEIEDASGLTKSRQQRTLGLVEMSAAFGITVAELEDVLGIGHGQASSALSHLHRAGRITRLRERRSKQEVYVLPVHINGRPESPYNARPQRKHPRFHSDRTVVEAMRVAELPLDTATYQHIRAFLEALP